MPLDSTQRTVVPSLMDGDCVSYLPFLTEIQGYISKFSLDHSKFLEWFQRRMDELIDPEGHPATATIDRSEADRWLRAFRVILEREYCPRRRSRSAS